MRNLNKKLIFCLILLIAFFYTSPALATGNCTGYAWGENVGWINFNPSQGGVTVTDSAVTGYAWGENVGWINLSPTYGGVTNDGNGNLSGYAWGENIGWINFNPTGSQVVINNSTGDFSGYAWGENVGWISFSCTNCNVNTSWRKVSAITGGGGMPAEWFNPPTPPAEGFGILINNDAPKTNSRFVTLTLKGGPNTERMAISNFPDFRDAGQEKYTQSKKWDLCQRQTTCPDGEYTVYVKFYAPWGTASEVVSDSIILKTVEKPITKMTVGELKEKITEILEKINQLKAQLQQLLEKEISEIPVGYKFDVNLKYGQRGDDVKYLQMFLKAQGLEIYPERIISGWFGPLTKKAVIRFQEKYADDILAPWGITEGTGFVGDTTRAKINEILSR